MDGELYRIDVLSDTHGYLPNETLMQCEGADLIVHAGDICGDDILPALEAMAPVVAVLGNNDWPGEYGPNVVSLARFTRMGIDFKVCHIPSRLGELDARIAICGHTHVASVQDIGACTVVNPGSVTRPRGGSGPTMARITLAQNYVQQIQIIKLADLK